MESFEIRQLSFYYPATEIPVLDSLNISIERGEFVTLCGPSGCGKSTLLRHLKPTLMPHGKREGEILFEGVPLSQLSERDQAAKIGFVMQNPESQVVTDKVWHELAFGMESLGFDTDTTRLRVAEMASFFGIENWFYKDVTELSGGQKQLLNLASIMTTSPSVLILDEPTSQLDPIAASDFLATVGKINRELGTTIIITEHRLEEVFPFTDRVMVMDRGAMIVTGSPESVGAELKAHGHSMFLAMPTPMRVYAAVPNALECPVSVRDGREWLDSMASERELLPELMSPEPPEPEGDTVVELEEVWFRYERESADVLKGLSCKIKRGEFFAILGGNGTGKSTTLSLIAERRKPYRGKVKLSGASLGVLPQNPQALFLRKTVREDLLEILTERKFNREQKERRLARVAKLCHLEQLMHMHPYDLSGGQQQRAALAKVLLTEPELLLLDEPTKGFDAEFKREFAEIIAGLTSAGVTVVMVSHDVEFCAKYATRCAMVFDGAIVTVGTPRRFFAGNSFYTTSANRMARQHLPGAVTAEDIIAALGGDTSPFETSSGHDQLWLVHEEDDDLVETKPKRSLTRKLVSLVSGALLVPTIRDIYRNWDGFKAFISGGELAIRSAANAEDTQLYVRLMLMLCAAATAFLISIRRPPDRKLLDYQVPPEQRVLTKRTLAAVVMVLVAIPITIFVGVFYLNDRQYYYISMMIIAETVLPFIMIFEGKRPQARELVIIAVMCGIGVAGRSAFFMLPQFKPVTAIVIIAGVAFGGEAGFLVGAVTGFVSNFFFGQGPWSPMQMFAFGIIGFVAGILFRKGILRRNRVALCVFGGIATFGIYGGIMDGAMVLMYQNAPTKEMFFLSYLQGIPFNLLHGLATVIFLWLISDTMLEKLDRIKRKYGLMEASPMPPEPSPEDVPEQTVTALGNALPLDVNSQVLRR